ncbi:MAG: caspase family protein [Nitrospirae bacterium]|nr:caspase family protein [Nitrospirota bacterium]
MKGGLVSKGKGISINIGLNSVDANHYNGWNGALKACENDARSMHSIAEELGYTSNLLLTTNAISGNVLRMLSMAATKLVEGDMLLLTYSGHGGQMPDWNGDESDGKDETICLYDRQLVDDELYQMWSRFRQGVRIFIVSDSCHSGTIIDNNPPGSTRGSSSGLVDKTISKTVPVDVCNDIYEKNKAFYRNLQNANLKTLDVIKASVILISACQDNQESLDGQANGLFTEKLLKVWDEGRFSGNYYDFCSGIKKLTPATQIPNMYAIGKSSYVFKHMRPFVIF